MGTTYHQEVIDCNTFQGFHQAVKLLSNKGMSKTSTRKENLKRLIDAKTKGNLTQFAELAGKKQSYLSDVLGGRKPFGEKAAASIETIMGLEDGFFEKPVMSLKGFHSLEENAEETLKPAPSRLIPVVGSAQLGDNGHWYELEYPVGHGDGFVSYPAKDAQAYALRCRGDSMKPRIKDGEFVLVEPNAEVNPGDEVMVKATDGRVMVKVFLYKRDGKIFLSSVNDAHPPISIPLEEVEKIHSVAAIARKSVWMLP